MILTVCHHRRLMRRLWKHKMCLFLAGLSIFRHAPLQTQNIWKYCCSVYICVPTCPVALLQVDRAEDGERRKSGNLVEGREHKKRTSGRIKVVTMLDEISSFFVYLSTHRHISQYFPPFSVLQVLHVSYIHERCKLSGDANGSANSIRRTIKQTPNWKVPFLSRITMMFFSLRTDFSVKSLNILQIWFVAKCTTGVPL